MKAKLTKDIFIEAWFQKDSVDGSRPDPIIIWQAIEADREAVRAETREETKNQLRLKYGGDFEDLLEQLFWEFDAEHKKSGIERDAFKGKMRFFAGKFAERAREELLKDHFRIGEEVILGTGEEGYVTVTTHYLDEKAIRRPAKKRPMTTEEKMQAVIDELTKNPARQWSNDCVDVVCRELNIPTEVEE